jgi:hypothetical protein
LRSPVIDLEEDAILLAGKAGIAPERLARWYYGDK